MYVRFLQSVLMRLSVSQLCFSSEELILIHRLWGNGTSLDMGRSGLSRLSPALVQQILSGACTKTTDSHTSEELTATESKRRRFWPLKLSTCVLFLNEWINRCFLFLVLNKKQISHVFTKILKNTQQPKRNSIIPFHFTPKTDAHLNLRLVLSFGDSAP